MKIKSVRHFVGKVFNFTDKVIWLVE